MIEEVKPLESVEGVLSQRMKKFLDVLNVLGKRRDHVTKLG